MNDDIIRMAQEAGFSHDPKTGHVVAVDGFTEVTVTPGLARFAALVRADEREACARIAERSPEKHWCVATIRARGKA